jgi:hypothetical protein
MRTIQAGHEGGIPQPLAYERPAITERRPIVAFMTGSISDWEDHSDA